MKVFFIYLLLFIFIPLANANEIINNFIWFGIWDYYRDSIAEDFTDYSNIGKSMSRSVSNIDMPAIMHIGGLDGENAKSRIRSISDFDTGNTKIVHFMDEPYKTMTAEELDDLVEYARSLYGNKYKYAYTINLYQLLNVHKFAEDFEYVFFQAYPYRCYSDTQNQAHNIGDSKQELFDELDLQLSRLKNAVPESDYFFVCQAFTGGKWRTPPVNAPLWYTEWAMQQSEVKGLLWWQYINMAPWKGLKDMPEYSQKIKEAFSLIPKQENERSTEITDMLWGWWYDEQGKDRNTANVIKVWADDIEKALKTDFKVIPFIGEGSRLDHTSSLSQFRSRYENKGIRNSP